ncbi:MAG: hypothetical protein LW722_11895 [Rubrivivax sp.]|nr:hypothetical protein [Rubrivivax sp.]
MAALAHGVDHDGDEGQPFVEGALRRGGGGQARPHVGLRDGEEVPDEQRLGIARRLRARHHRIRSRGRGRGRHRRSPRPRLALLALELGEAADSLSAADPARAVLRLGGADLRQQPALRVGAERAQVALAEPEAVCRQCSGGGRVRSRRRLPPWRLECDDAGAAAGVARFPGG